MSVAFTCLLLMLAEPGEPRENVIERAMEQRIFEQLEVYYDERLAFLQRRIPESRGEGYPEVAAELQKELRKMRILRDKEYYLPKLTELTVGQIGFVQVRYQVKQVMGPRDVMLYIPDRDNRDLVAWLHGFNTEHLADDDTIDLSRQIIWVSGTRRQRVNGMDRKMPELLPVLESELHRIWTTYRAKARKKGR